MKSIHHTPFWGWSRSLLFLLVLFLAPILSSQAQESAENTTSEAAAARPLEESLLIFDTGEPTEAAENDEVQGGPLVSSWDFLRMVLILAAVVGVIYLIFWLLKRSMRRQLPQNDLIHLLGTRNLTGNRALHLVEHDASPGILNTGIGKLYHCRNPLSPFFIPLQFPTNRKIV